MPKFKFFNFLWPILKIFYFFYINKKIKHNNIMYYNYHAQAKKLISENHTLSAAFFDSYRHISPALVIYFDNHKPMPIREYMWEDYLPLLKSKNIKILDNRKR